MNLFDQMQPSKTTSYRSIAGILLILAGAVLFLDRYLKTGWLSMLILPGLGMFIYLWGARVRHSTLILWGAVLGGAGAGSALAFIPTVQPATLFARAGMVALYTGLGWLLVAVSWPVLVHRPAWWTLVPGGILVGTGYCLLFTTLHWTEIVLYLCLGTGLPLLLWGLGARLIGLVIPGSLLVTAGPGIYAAWRTGGDVNTLVQTGVMLVWFAFGWGLITLSGRWINHRFLWWPLIPGGILAMVGWGLFIGGDPDHALGFISNTGSIALMIFGLYLLLMRKGIHH